jgi:hypothetical protein
MHIRPTQPGRVDITAYTRRTRSVFPEQSLSDAPTLAIDDPIPGFFEDVYRFSDYGPGELLGWMRELLPSGQASEPAAPNLLICDHSEAPVPWEAIDLGGEKHLGAVSGVARWVPIRRNNHPRNLEFWPDIRSGRVLALGTVPGEALSRWAVDQVDSLNALWQQLFAAHDQYALVYIGGLSGATLNLSRKQIDGRRPLFVVEAAGLGRLICHGQVVKGSAEPLLGQVADGLIGLAGGSPAAATTLLAGLLDRLTPTTSVAEAIRQARQEACVRWSDTPAEEPSLATAFLLHYYGNPLLRLELTPASQPEGGR